MYAVARFLRFASRSALRSSSHTKPTHRVSVFREIPAARFSSGSGRGSRPARPSAASGIAALLVGAVGWALLGPREAHAEERATQEEPRKIRLSEIHEHRRGADALWVFKGDRVYDITDWVPNHPGGDVILRAAGGNVEPYWNIFTIHQKQDVYDILEQYFVGVIDPRDLVDGRVASEQIDDPFATDPERDPRLRKHSDRPCNAETPASELGTFITPNSVFYVRNHLWVPEVSDADDHRVTVEMGDGSEKEYSVQDLRRLFKEYKVTATLQCSGNRRAHMTAGSRPTNGLQWDVGAIGTAEWTGVRLRDVLTDAGVPVDDLPPHIKHAQFLGAEAYGASIPIEKAVDNRGDVMLVYEMNGQPLPRDHGYPLRVLVPGNVAARSVKWVKRITMSEEESTSQWQRRDYKCFGPNEGTNPDWDRARSIQEMPVQSAITSVEQVSTGGLKDNPAARVYGLEEESFVLEGYAFSGGGREIVRVDVSVDNGRTWQQADLLDNDAGGCKAWSWKQWRFSTPKRQTARWFVVKAVDEAYNTQADSFEPHYNFRGNLASAWHRVPVQLARD